MQFELIENFLKNLNSLKISWIRKFYLEKRSIFIQTSHIVHDVRLISRTYRLGVGAAKGVSSGKSWCLTEYFQVFCTIWMKIRLNLMICFEFIENFLNSKIYLAKCSIFISPWLAVHVVHVSLSHISQWCGCQEGSFTSKILIPNWTFIRE